VGVCAPHGWNLTEISDSQYAQSSQGKFDAGLPRSAKFSKALAKVAQSQAGFSQAAD
jgi:hypothetical protein